MMRAFAAARFAARLARARRGVVIIEYAFYTPVLLLLGLTGAEITNYVITRMRISQLALHLADNSARIGTGTLLQQKTINEVDINDLLTGAELQAGELDLFGRGRVIISSVENAPSQPTKYRIRWQRCKGAKAFNPSWDPPGNRDGFGPSNRPLVTAPPDGATMLVAVAYDYQPLIRTSLSPPSEMIEVASMMVRDRRALDAGTNGVVQVPGETPASSNC